MCRVHVATNCFIFHLTYYTFGVPTIVSVSRILERFKIGKLKNYIVISVPQWFDEKLINTNAKALGVYMALLYLMFKAIPCNEDEERTIRIVKNEIDRVMLEEDYKFRAKRSAEEFIKRVYKHRYHITRGFISRDRVKEELDSIEINYYEIFKKSCYENFKKRYFISSLKVLDDESKEEILKILRSIKLKSDRKSASGSISLNRYSSDAYAYKFTGNVLGNIHNSIDLLKLKYLESKREILFFARVLTNSGILWFKEIIPAPFLEDEFEEFFIEVSTLKQLEGHRKEDLSNQEITGQCMELKQYEVSYELFERIQDKQTLKLYIEDKDKIKEFKAGMKILFLCGEECIIAFDVTNVDYREGYLSLAKSKTSVSSEPDKVLKLLANIIDRCDNALANLEFDENMLRAKVFRIAKLASIMYDLRKLNNGLIVEKGKNELLLLNPDMKTLNELKNVGVGKFVVTTKLLEQIRDNQLVKFDELVQLAENLAIETNTRIIEILNELKERGYAEIRDLKHDIDSIMKCYNQYLNKYFKIVIVPKHYEVNPLQFKHYYEASKTDKEKVIYNFKQIVSYIEAVFEEIKDDKGYLSEIFHDLVKNCLELGKALDEFGLTNEINKLTGLIK